MPTADHDPILKMNGGHLTVDNGRLAHRLCNRFEYSKQIGRSHAKDLARVKAARQATHVNGGTSLRDERNRTGGRERVTTALEVEQGRNQSLVAALWS